MAKTSNKVFDVSRPGTTKPQTGSKPMVVGHKSISSDPTIKADVDDSNPRVLKKEPDTKIVAKKKKKIEPIKPEEKPDEASDTEAASIEKNAAESEPGVTIQSKVTTDEDSKNSSEEKSVESNPENTEDTNDDSSSTSDTSDSDKESTKDDSPTLPEKDAADEQIAREEKLASLIRSKKYNVDIKESHGSESRTFATTFIAVFIVGAVIIALLADAEVLDLGVSLPFDYL
ncbi:MAG: hypothetical protein ACI9T8_000618 [Candidatus Saccharimonadales bacterium]|jgi:hypothetical protein